LFTPFQENRYVYYIERHNKRPSVDTRPTVKDVGRVLLTKTIESAKETGPAISAVFEGFRGLVLFIVLALGAASASVLIKVVEWSGGEASVLIVLRLAHVALVIMFAATAVIIGGLGCWSAVLQGWRERSTSHLEVLPKETGPPRAARINRIFLRNLKK
jgi:hypothetical protein